MKSLFVLMTFLVAVILLTLPVPAHAAMRMQSANMTIVLRTDPCVDPKVLGFIEERYQAAFQVADLMYRGKPLKACWMAVPSSGNILMVDETGDYGPVPMAMFKPVVAM